MRGLTAEKQIGWRSKTNGSPRGCLWPCGEPASEQRTPSNRERARGLGLSLRQPPCHPLPLSRADGARIEMEGVGAGRDQARFIHCGKAHDTRSKEMKRQATWWQCHEKRDVSLLKSGAKRDEGEGIKHCKKDRVIYGQSKSEGKKRASFEHHIRSIENRIGEKSSKSLSFHFSETQYFVAWWVP